jgi:hypothetical protein
MRALRTVTLRVAKWAFPVVGILLAIAAWPTAVEAQQASGTISAVTGRVEVLSKGQTAWQQARLGTQVREGDEVRAFAGASAELRLPDASTVFVAENTRFAVTKLDFTPQNQMRSAFFHLAVGKIRGIIAQAAVALVQARQNNFAITTPTAVAAVRGTTLYASFDPVTRQTTFFVADGVAIIRDLATGQTVTLSRGQVITQSQGQPLPAPAPATPAQEAQITAAAQPAPAGAAAVLNAPTVVVVPADVVVVQISPPPAPAAAPTVTVTPAPPPPTTRPASPF